MLEPFARVGARAGEDHFDACSITLMPAADPADKLVMIAVEAADNSEHMLTPTAG